MPIATVSRVGVRQAITATLAVFTGQVSSSCRREVCQAVRQSGEIKTLVGRLVVVTSDGDVRPGLPSNRVASATGRPLAAAVSENSVRQTVASLRRV